MYLNFEKDWVFCSGYQWTGVPNVLLYHQDNDGDENYRLYKINISTVRKLFIKEDGGKFPHDYLFKPSPFNPVYTVNEKAGVKVREGER